MVFIIAKIAGTVMPLFIDGWAVVDFSDVNWHVPFHMTGFNDKVLKGLKKDELHHIGYRMHLKLDKTNDKGKTTSKTIAEMRSTIESGWSGYFAAPKFDAPAPEAVVPKQKGMFNHGSMIECFECGRMWPSNQGVECSVCHRIWTRQGIKSTATAPVQVSIDLINLFDTDKLIKQSLFYNILFKKLILKTTLLKHILKEIKQILLNMFCFI
jgi:hypothetical protein